MFSVQWGCPEGYYKLMEDCFKPVREHKEMYAAKEYCEAEGGMLARPQHELDVNNSHK